MAWMFNGKDRDLLFAGVELIPEELGRPPQEPRDQLKISKVGDRARIYFERFVMDAEDALAWYANCRNGIVELPGSKELKAVATGVLKEEPQWPSLITGAEFPFTGDVLASHRTHHLIPPELPQCVQAMQEVQPDAIRWMSEKIYVDLARYPELLGTINLLVPNPVLRSFEHRLGVGESGEESSRLSLVARSGKSLETLSVLLTEVRPTGPSNVTFLKVDNRYLEVSHSGRVEEVSLAMMCSVRGLLEWQGPTGFFRTVHFRSHVPGASKRVTVPSRAGEVPESYEVPQRRLANRSAIGDLSTEDPITARIRSLRHARTRADEGVRLGQKWFHGNHHEAKLFIRTLTQKAERRVWIVDPYFATAELFSFALATSSSEVEVLVLTSGQLMLKNQDAVDASREAGELLLEQYKALKKQSQLNILVMTGDRPVFHDRFLVIDDAVWLSGNSLGTIGERAGMMISLPDPAPVIQKIQEIVRDAVLVKPLEEWVTNRQKSKTNGS